MDPRHSYRHMGAEGTEAAWGISALGRGVLIVRSCQCQRWAAPGAVECSVQSAESIEERVGASIVVVAAGTVVDG